MKAAGLPIAALDGNALPLEAESGQADDSASSEGFDALLALANAQAMLSPLPVKALAPSVGLTGAAVDAPKVTAEGATSTSLQGTGKGSAALFSGPHADVGPTQSFLPWLALEGPAALPLAPTSAPAALALTALAAPERLVSDGEESLAPEVAASAAAELGASAAQALSAAQPKLSDQAPAASVGLAKANVSAPHQSAAHQSAQPESAAGIGPSRVALTSPEPAQAISLEPVQAASPEPAQPTSPKLAKAASSEPAQAVSPQLVTVDVGLSQVAPSPSPERPALASGPVAQPAAQVRGASQRPQQALSAEASAALASIPMSNPETKAVVTKIEIYETSASPDALGLPAESSSLLEETAQAVAPEARAGQDASASERDPGAGEREPSAELPVPARVVAPPRFEVTEGPGMRGLDAVVASLLRSSDDTTRGERGVRVPTRSAPHVSVETGKSQSLRVEERVSNVTQALDLAALKREEERLEARETVAAGEPQHMLQSLDFAASDAGASVESAPTPSAPTAQAAAPLPDPDAALMGKLARGESLNAAISIEHPELGSMDVLVENQNGRIDVRATLDTSRAAAVLRAHESALRYGVQQAGMAFGALRVRTRTGDTQTERSRDALKRRRDRDWEA